MKIVHKSIDELIPYENNPRINDHAVEAVANSIKEFGFKNPVIVDKNNIIIAGHTRVKAAEELGIDKIPVIYADDLSDEQVKAFRLADNKTAELADWDFSLLDAELEELSKLDFDFEMSDFGFENSSQEKIFDTDEQFFNDKEIIIIEYENNNQLEKAFNELTEMGYPCRISTL